MEIKKCKNCGHDIIYGNGEWLHYHGEKGFMEGTMLCWFDIITDESKEFVQIWKTIVLEEIHKNFGNFNVDIDFNISCNCVKPEAKL